MFEQICVCPTIISTSVTNPAVGDSIQKLLFELFHSPSMVSEDQMITAIFNIKAYNNKIDHIYFYNTEHSLTNRNY